jgi:hypothetical protein
VRRADNLATFVCGLSENHGSLNLLEPSGSSTGIVSLLPYFLLSKYGIGNCVAWCEKWLLSATEMDVRVVVV